MFRQGHDTRDAQQRHKEQHDLIDHRQDILPEAFGEETGGHRGHNAEEGGIEGILKDRLILACLTEAHDTENEGDQRQNCRDDGEHARDRQTGIYRLLNACVDDADGKESGNDRD